MSANEVAAPGSTSRARVGMRGGGLDPFRFAWALLINVKFALVLVGTAAAAGLVGTVIPQVPGPMRANPAARAAWIELKHQDYGLFTGPMDRLALFDVFHSAWFSGLWMLITVAVTVCTVSRFRPTWRSVHRPQKAVADAYFEHAHQRASFTNAGDIDAVESLLRQRRYHVERTQTAGDVTYLFAERYSWSQYGTFLSHLALLMLLVGGLLTVFAGYSRTIVIAEAAPAAPVFNGPGPDQIFVGVRDAYRGMDAQGNIVDYHSILEVRRGAETKVCKTSVNDPCTAFGYRIHQAAFFNDLAKLRVTDPAGRVVYDDILDFENRTTAVPVIRVTDASGTVLFDQELPQMGTDPGVSPAREDDVALAALTFPSRANDPAAPVVTYAVAWHVVEGRLRLVVSGDGAAPAALSPGDSATLGSYRVELLGGHDIPAVRIDDMPGADGGNVVIQMPVGGDGRPYLFATGLEAANLAISEGQAVTSRSGYTYTFGGRVEASGVSVKRDPGDTFIWVAVGMAVIGLAITFYVPRRRLWVKVTPSRTWMAGIAERTTRFSRELRLMGAELGAPDALEPRDLDTGEN
jgi:cytochrome c biogenesis protein